MNTIHITGLGAGDINQLPLGIYRLLQSSSRVYVRTMDHPVLEELKGEIDITGSFDDIYTKHANFGDVYEEIASILINESVNGDVVYAVPGHPMVAEKTVQILLHEAQQGSFKVNVAGGQSFLDATFAALNIDPIDGFQMADALTFKKGELQYRHHIVLCQVYDQMVASEAKLTLMEELPFDYEVYIVTAAGSVQEEIIKVPLYELDRVSAVSNLTSLYIPPVQDEKLLYHRFEALRGIIAALRGPGGCLWDQKQTFQSLKKYLIEECYELLDAIESEDIDHMIEEMGDVLLQVVLQAQIGEDEGLFSMDEVIRSISEKMVRRHPHVFGDTQADTAEEVLVNWEAIKKAEGKTAPESLLDSVPGALPALSKAYQLQKKAAKAGFDWDKAEDAWLKVKEELLEFEEEMKQNPSEENRGLLKEFGDLLFALVNIGRFLKIEPEEALSSTNQKFTTRFRYIEKKAKENQENLEELPLEKMDRYWDEAKELE
ncbi:nucleoside triphosphate pyrophosphohydrolase [Bacillus sp. FJAT-42376]|uniref:nucleoside triphosphate pyrophosphohydrolase n=1 Tax=Bacillus sp. FJAT-42376 TaxID=2014076 RepID=UPI000F50A96A|nr:nucleoside triphosphate pyrophosphohydrolase [Bacillus sp. FJAT-42376]AZB41197.1 nucleoside triphosphate pyrophosphohydrolase [Bacillus sp. FJAT-42376]